MTSKFSYLTNPEDSPRSVVREEHYDYSIIGKNSGFKPIEFDGIRMQRDLNSFVLTP
jgi:hypothetical protein